MTSTHSLFPSTSLGGFSQSACRRSVWAALGLALLVVGPQAVVAQPATVSAEATATNPAATNPTATHPTTATSAATTNPGTPAAVESRFSHADWDQVLSRFVDEEGMVDYLGLAKDRAALDRYLDDLAARSPVSHPNDFPTRQEALAYYLNAYNAYVFDGVLAGGGDQKSVWATMVQGYKFFIGRKIFLGGEKTHLKKLEDDSIREDFGDPRIHAALVCAAVSCPKLPQKAFVGASLEADLDTVFRQWVNDPQHVRMEDGEVHLSKIFDWFDDDFLDYEKRQGNAKPQLVDYINRFRDPAEALPRGVKVRFIDYDKSLNKQAP